MLKLAIRTETFSNDVSTRAYVKADVVHRQGGVIQESQKKRQRSAAGSFNASRELVLESMSVGQMRTDLRFLGTQMSCKCPQRICDMLCKALQSSENGE